MTYTHYIHDRLAGGTADVSSAAADVVFAGATDFNDGADKGVEYTYDANRGITSISYNALGLPAEVTFSDGSGITNRYGADGTLLQRVSREPLRMTVPVTLAAVTRPTVETVHNHIGAMTYRKGALWRIDTPSGYISADGQAHHYIRDHQGNVRQVTDSDGNVEQDNHYYPYGMLMGESGDILATARNGRNPLKPSDANPYLYGSKEYLTTAGANLLDFTARTYDPSTLLFHTPDPLRDKYLHVTPYLYCLGNPINLIDPTGMKVAYSGTDTEIAEFKEIIDSERQEESFDKIFQSLEDSEETYTFQFGDIPPMKSSDGNEVTSCGVFNRREKTITISSGMDRNDRKNIGNVIAEESYHAFQTIKDPSVNDAVNIEYEAQVFAYMHTINRYGGEFSNVPLVIFISDLRDKIPDSSVQPHLFLESINEESFRSSYSYGFSFFLEAVRNIDSPYYTNPSAILPDRLSQTLNLKK